MKNVITIVAVGLLAQMTFAQQFTLSTGSVLKCYDDVTSLVYTLKVIDEGDEATQILVKTPHGKTIERIKSKYIDYGQNSEGTYFKILNNKSKYLVGLEVSNEIMANGIIEGIAYDNGDSRAIECSL